jgi:alkylation response protein AidB-like acyl-CoA dehydrogenase
MGLRGTGSCDFSIVDYHAPPELVMQWDLAMPQPLRGGALYRLPSLAFVAHEHVAFAAGLARRALDEMTRMATTQRGKYRPTALTERAVFHRRLGESDLKLRAVRTLALDLLEDTWQKVCRGESIGPASQAELRGVATYITEIAVDITSWAFRYGGGGALYQPNIFERLLREMNAAAQHILTSDTAYENHGKFRLGLPDANPMD